MLKYAKILVYTKLEGSNAMNFYQKKYTVLVVEDEEIITEAIKKSIDTFEEFELIDITDGEDEALEIAKAKHPDIILVDIDINQGCGQSLMRIIKSDKYFKNHMPFLYAITAYTSSEKRRQLKRYADDTFIKRTPFHADRLFSQLLFKIFDLANQENNFHQNEEQRVKNIIKQELEMYAYKPRTNDQRKYITHMVYLTIITPDDKREPTLKQLQEIVVKNYRLKSTASLNTSLDRYIKDIYELTPPEKLKNMNDFFSEDNKPSVSHFLDQIVSRIKAKI